MQTKTIEETREFLEDMAEELNALAEMDQMEMYRMLTEVGNEIPAIAAEEKPTQISSGAAFPMCMWPTAWRTDISGSGDPAKPWW
jgi:hypothetical protein